MIEDPKWRSHEMGQPMEIDLSIPGAKAERAKLARLHQVLNASEVVPDQAYRISSGSYPLISYVNHIIALYFSKNYDVIPLGRMHSFSSTGKSPIPLLTTDGSKFICARWLMYCKASPLSRQRLWTFIFHRS